MRTVALIKRIILEMVRDKRTLALLFFAPLLVLSLMYFIFNSTTANPTLGVSNIDNHLVQTLQNANIDVKQESTVTADTVKKEGLDGILQMEDGKFKLTLKNDDPSTAKALQMKITQAIASQAQAAQNVNMVQANIKQPSIDTHYVYGSKDTTFFDVLGPALIAFFVFFFVFLISGIGLLRERTTGTLERLMATPIRRMEIIFGYLIGYGIFAVIQTIIVVLYAVKVLDITLVGSVWNVILVNLIVAFVALSLGILLSTFASSEFQMIQFIPLVVIPQVFFAGIFPLNGMAAWLVSLGKVMPLYYAADAIKGVMYKGEGLGDISRDIMTLLLFVVVFITLNVFVMKKYRKQ
ncbi:ABC transporter permease [Ectobacillus polymachus]|uniref:ABC transporter permease n=1 Tax=Ectobacillus polymachus TaxID=1508806 RepID=UPI003A86B3E4